MKIDINKELGELKSFIRYSIEKLDIKTVLHTIHSSEDALCKGVERIKQKNGLVEARMPQIANRLCQMSLDFKNFKQDVDSILSNDLHLIKADAESFKVSILGKVDCLKNDIDRKLEMKQSLEFAIEKERFQSSLLNSEIQYVELLLANLSAFSKLKSSKDPV